MTTPTVLAVVGDLLFTVKISEAAKRAGVTVRCVTKEEVFLERAKENPPLIIFDLNFDAMRPLELIAKIKADPALKQIPLLGYLSHVQEDLKVAAQQTGCDEVIPRSAFSMHLPEILKRAVGVTEKIGPPMNADERG